VSGCVGGSNRLGVFGDLAAIEAAIVESDLIRSGLARRPPPGTVMKLLRRRPLCLDEIRSWASAYREWRGAWPTKSSGPISGALGETWAGVDRALREGLRGLPGGSSLAQFLADDCGARHLHRLPPLTEDLVLAWADAWHERIGEWPTADSGTIPGPRGHRGTGRRARRRRLRPQSASVERPRADSERHGGPRCDERPAYTKMRA
jgi:hypothetical protein